VASNGDVVPKCAGDPTVLSPRSSAEMVRSTGG
jgi:hypothetical protein